jgi:hypothetical protein
VGAAYHPVVPGGAEVLSDDSPLHRLPSSLDRQQVLFLDGISFSVYMTSIGYQRLQALLYEETLAEQPTHVRQALIVMDDWSIIDTVNRLRVLVEGVKSIGGLRRGPAVTSLLKSVHDVETLRNAVQHQDEQVEKLRQNGRPLWGSLSWLYRASPDAKEFRVVVMIPGTLAKTGGVPFVKPEGREYEVPVGLVELTAAGVTVCLSDVMKAVGRFAVRLERAAVDAFAAIPEGATDYIARLDLPVD